MTLRGMSAGEIRICFPAQCKLMPTFHGCFLQEVTCLVRLCCSELTNHRPPRLTSVPRSVFRSGGADPEPGLQHPANAA